MLVAAILVVLFRHGHRSYTISRLYMDAPVRQDLLYAQAAGRMDVTPAERDQSSNPTGES